MFGAVSSRACHPVAPSLSWAGRTTGRRTEPGTYRRNQQSKHGHERKEARTRSMSRKWSILVHSLHFTLRCRFPAVNSHFIENVLSGVISLIGAKVSLILRTRKRMVGLGRFELPTLGLGNQCSIHLSYSPCSHSNTCLAFVCSSCRHSHILVCGLLQSSPLLLLSRFPQLNHEHLARRPPVIGFGIAQRLCGFAKLQ